MTEKSGLGVHDVLGIAGAARAVERVTDSALSGVEAVLGRICLPAAEELGLLLRDKVSAWRKQNILSTVEKAQPLLQAAASENRHGPPRLIMESLNQASWTDREEVQQMWAGLLASSCTADGEDDNWIFVNLLGQLTAMQVCILKYTCEAATKIVLPTGLIAAVGVYRKADELIALTGCADVQRIDRELDHLRVLGLIEVGFRARGDDKQPEADLQPTALALHLYVRAQGSLQNPIEYFGLSANDAPPAV